MIQGDCMTPVLSLFMIMAFVETLDISWKQSGHKMITFNTRTNSSRNRGRLTGNVPKTFSYGTLIEIFNVLYADNGAFPFEDRDQLSKGVQFISEKFKIFGPVIHIERGAKPSKTECVFFSPPVFFKRK